MELKDRIFALLDDLDVRYRYEEHEAVFSVSESMVLLKDKRPTKNLVLNDKSGRCVMVVMDGVTRLDTKKISTALSMKKLNFVKPDVLMEKLNVTPGSVSVFGLLNVQPGDLDVVLDTNILGDEQVGFHPNDNTSTIFISGCDLEKIVKASGHKPHLIDLSHD